MQVDWSLSLVTMASNQKSTTMVAPFCQEQKVASVKYSNIKVSITRKYLQNISFWAYKTQTGIFPTLPLTVPLSPPSPSAPSTIPWPCPWGWTRSWCVASGRILSHHLLFILMESPWLLVPAGARLVFSTHNFTLTYL